MANINRLIDFVNGQASYQLERSEHYAAQQDSQRAASYYARYEEFIELESFLDSKRPAPASSINITPDDLVGLPPELIAELNISDSDKKEFVILDVLKDLGGLGSIDKLMIGIYKRSGEIYDRNKLMARLYRMSVKELIYQHPSRKGVYSLEKLWIAEDEQQNEEEKPMNDS